MKRGMFVGGMLAAAALIALPQLADARSGSLFDATSCDKGRDRASDPRATLVSWCLVTVPNGNFAGAQRPAGSETGNYRHPWEPAFSWTQITPRTEHPVRDHLMPWGYLGEGEPSYATGVNARPGVVVSHPGDSVFQWLPVPGDDGTWDGATSYTVRVTYAPYGGKGSVGLGIKLIAADDDGEKVSIAFEDAKAGTSERPGMFEARLEVPPNTRVTQLGVALGKTGDATPLLIQDVAVVEAKEVHIDF